MDLELACAEHPDPSTGPVAGTVVRLPTCAADVAPHEVVELLGVGAARVEIRLDGCADPARTVAHLGPVVAVVAAGAPGRLLLTRTDTTMPSGTGTTAPAVPAEPSDDGRVATGSPAPARRRPVRRHHRVLDAAHMPVSRRGLLGLGPGAGRALPPETDDHARLTAAVAALVPAGSAALEAKPSPASRLTARGCTACGVCVLACPAGALGWRESGSGPVLATLEQSVAACDGCLRCVGLCPAGVLAEAGRHPWADVLSDATVPVVTLATARCDRCGARFPTTTGGALCPVCDFRRRNPFGSMPAARRG